MTSKKLTLDIRASRKHPAFAGYYVGSGKKGPCRMFVNVDAMLWTAAEHRGLKFKRLFAESLAHEFLHALEEQFGLLFNEKKVEAAIMRARPSSRKTKATDDL